MTETPPADRAAGRAEIGVTTNPGHRAAPDPLDVDRPVQAHLQGGVTTNEPIDTGDTADVVGFLDGQQAELARPGHGFDGGAAPHIGRGDVASKQPRRSRSATASVTRPDQIRTGRSRAATTPSPMLPGPN